MFKETKIIMSSNKVSKTTKLLVFSDIHFSGNRDIKKLERLYNRIKNYDIDYICIPGDTIDSPNINSDYMINFFTKISNICPVILSLGNHDIRIKRKCYQSYYDDDFWNKISKIENVFLLNNNCKRYKDIYFYGYTQSFNYYYEFMNENKDLMLKEINEYGVCDRLPNNFRVLLMHSPICVNDEKIKEKLNNYDLILSGHMHNGVVPPVLDEIFDNNAGIISPGKKLFPKNARGIIKKDNIIVISSGITKLSKSAGKLFNRLNFLFPMGINYIKITNEFVEYKKSIKYYR